MSKDDAYDSWNNADECNEDEEEELSPELEAQIADLEEQIAELHRCMEGMWSIDSNLPYEALRKIDINKPETIFEAVKLAKEQKEAKEAKENPGARSTSEAASSDGSGPSANNTLPAEGDVRRCEYMMANNRRCGSPAMRNRRHCYFHGGANARAKSKRLIVPVLENQKAIQMAVTRICQGIADERLDPRRATSLLYGLQVASCAVPKARAKRG